MEFFGGNEVFYERVFSFMKVKPPVMCGFKTQIEEEFKEGMESRRSYGKMEHLMGRE